MTLSTMAMVERCDLILLALQNGETRVLVAQKASMHTSTHNTISRR